MQEKTECERRVDQTVEWEVGRQQHNDLYFIPYS